MVPEYKRHLKNIVISMNAGTATLDVHHELLLSLPSYTNILLLADEDHTVEIRSLLETLPYGPRTRVLPFNPEMKSQGTLYLLDNGKQFTPVPLDRPVPLQIGTFWMQDAFVPVLGRDNSLRIIIPPFHMSLWLDNTVPGSAWESDLGFIESLGATGVKSRETSVVFNGGNLRFAERDDTLTVFCGSDIVHNTALFSKSFKNKDYSSSRIQKILKRKFGADRVVIIDETVRQPYYMYHLDQAFMIVDDSVACVTRVVGDSAEFARYRKRIDQVTSHLESVRATLTTHGFRIVDIDTPVQNIIRGEFYVNAVPYIDTERGDTCILFPAYDFRTQSDRDILAANIEKLTGLGYRVLPVRMKSNKLRGGLHCMVNVLE